MTSIDKGYVHVYTGNGKGKTTAAFGLALRAAGNSLKTVVVQFMKGKHYSELDSVKLFGSLIKIEQYGHPTFCGFTDPPDAKDVQRAQAALSRLKELYKEPPCDIIIADEIITAMMFKLLDEQEVLDLIKEKPEGIELVLTGRGATPSIIEAADLATEMRELKHYYTKGIQARKGIES